MVKSINGSPEPGSSRHAGAALVLIGLLLLPVLYVASVGPACLLCMSGTISEESLNRIYAPLVFLVERSEMFQGLLESYIELWTGG